MIYREQLLSDEEFQKEIDELVASAYIPYDAPVDEDAHEGSKWD